MKCILLAGGKGKRLWPLSTDQMPKQIVNIGDYNSCMLEKTYQAVSQICKEKDIYISTGIQYVEKIKSIFQNFDNFILENECIGTFGAILNIAVYLENIKNTSQEETIAIIPIDHEVSRDFYDALNIADKRLRESTSGIGLVGIQPTLPSSQYGYIIEENGIAKSFHEKPTIEKAEELIANKALWNSGLLIFKLGFMIQIAKKYQKYKNYEDFQKKYTSLPHNSFDKEVLEKEDNVLVVRSNESWCDMGTWDVLADKLSTPDQFNTNIINFEDKKIVNDGVDNSIIVNSPNGIRLIKKKNTGMEFRKWGFFKVIQDFDRNKRHIRIKDLVIFPNQNISYQYHNERSETWYLIKGDGEVIIEGKIKKVKAGDIISIPVQKKHSMRAHHTIEFVEVQYGTKKIREEDIVRLGIEWDEILKSISE